MVDESAIDVGAKPHIEGPIPFGNCVLYISGKFLDIRVTVKVKRASSCCQIEWSKIRAGSVDRRAGHIQLRFPSRIRQARQESRIDDSETEILRQQRALVSGPYFQIVDSLNVRNVA